MTPDLLLKKMDKAAEKVVEVGEFKFTIRRPTKQEIGRFVADNETAYELPRRFVVGWEGVKESDLVRSGASDAVPFDRRLWERWLADRDDFWEPLTKAIMQSFSDYLERTEETTKNS